MSRGRPPSSGNTPVVLDLIIESLDNEGRGVAHHDGKVIFVEGALPGERVHAVSHRRKPSYEEASVRAVIRESASRVRPRCRDFDLDLKSGKRCSALKLEVCLVSWFRL